GSLERPTDVARRPMEAALPALVLDGVGTEVRFEIDFARLVRQVPLGPRTGEGAACLIRCRSDDTDECALVDERHAVAGDLAELDRPQRRPGRGRAQHLAVAHARPDDVGWVALRPGHDRWPGEARDTRSRRRRPTRPLLGRCARSPSARRARYL